MLRDIHLSVLSGEVVALLGTNGAGKSSLLKCLAGTVRPRRGAIKWEGRDVTGVPAWRRARSGLALVPEGQQTFPSMTVWENLWVGAQAQGMSRSTFAGACESVFDQFPRLAERRGQIAGTLSGGERQMLAVGRALIGRPRLLMLDEPSHGLAPMLVEQIADMVQQVARSTVVLVAEQNLLIPRRCASRVIVLENSRIVIEGPAQTVLAGDSVAAKYLGMQTDSSERSA
ncbi:MAG: ABC transporter ATP-binding protein [Lautropia sp.]